MHPRLSVSEVSMWAWTLDEDLAFCTQAGIHTLGVSWRKLSAAGVDVGVRNLLDAGVAAADLIETGSFVLDDPQQWPAQRARLTDVAAAGAALGAPCIVVTSGRPGALTWEESAGALERALTPVVSTTPVPLALEHTNSFRVDLSFVHTMRDAVDLARRLGTGVCMEVNACWKERALADTVADAVGDGTLTLVQLSDFAVGTRCTPDRLVPGDGDIPLARIVEMLVGAGYRGPFELELVGPRIDDEGYASAVGRSIAALDALLERAGA